MATTHSGTGQRKVRATAPSGGSIRKGNRYQVPTAPTSTATYANLCAIAAPVQQCPGCLAPASPAHHRTGKGLCTCAVVVPVRIVPAAPLQAAVVARHVQGLRNLPSATMYAGYVQRLPKALRAAVVQAAYAMAA
jgi:hypothetical protein